MLAANLEFKMNHCVALLLFSAPLLTFSATVAPNLGGFKAPTKGYMTGIVGQKWTFRVDTSDADHLGFLPEIPADTSAERLSALEVATVQSYQYMKDWNRYKGAMLAGGYYTSGKGFQKVGMICLLLEKFFTLQDNRTQECIGWLDFGFRCYYDPAADARECQGVSTSYYDGDWGGIVSRYGWDRKDANSDYGNVAYNDHHYHFGYFVVSAAILAKLKPETLSNQLFVSYVNTLIRDTANPSSSDPYFPPFRTFDWFDLHSWSHGISPMYDGKDQESTSEELNLLYGLSLWGSVSNNTALQKLGSTMLTLASKTVREFFLMKTGNTHHPEAFVKNHVTGIFLQGKVDYTTWFGGRPEHIHGIQMLPLSPALKLTRRKDFCQQEYSDILSKADWKSMTKPWISVLLTGSIAFLDSESAYRQLFAMGEGDLDGGLSRAWALYWATSRPGDAAQFSEDGSTEEDPSATSVRHLISADAPNQQVFPPRTGHPIYQPSQSNHKSPLSTNKFWVNWVVKDGGKYPIYTSPYMLSFSTQSNSQMLQIAHGSPVYFMNPTDKTRMKAYVNPNNPDIYIGAKEGGLTGPRVIQSNALFGATVELSGSNGKSVEFPVFSGMAYVSGKFSGLTPRIWHPNGFQELKKVSPGAWNVQNRFGATFRIYGFTNDVSPLDDSFDFDSSGSMNKQLEGWLRLALVPNVGDESALDAHAAAIITDVDVDVMSDGSIHYNFQKLGDSDLLHWAFAHHLQLIALNSTDEAPPLLL